MKRLRSIVNQIEVSIRSLIPEILDFINDVMDDNKLPMELTILHRKR
ncbi:MAG: hypothetical protein JWQ84_3329 [Mucilaginibacter sp.]|nr:hypothetical protein [Mucilaginibacter sp.]MDB5018497.1 hypothetical protein [Mucilaginibacter sp.]